MEQIHTWKNKSTLTEVIAEALNGTEYGEPIDQIVLKNAKMFGAVIVFGASDDLVEFRGAIDDEAGCYGSGTIYFNRSGELRSECEIAGCPYFEKIKKNASKIKAIWDAEGYSWIYETDIPYETFEILEDGEKYCRGLVFSINDVKED